MIDDSTDTEMDSLTIPKSILGDRQCKPGEKLTFTVTDVDPDTGDVEATLGGYAGNSERNGEGSSMKEDMADYPMET